MKGREVRNSFWRQVDIRGPDDCWEWKGSKNSKGYGRFLGNGTHRVALESSIGPIPLGKLVLHKCNNPPCCNPRHLYVGTQVDNMRDRLSKRYIIYPDGLLPANEDLAELYV